MVKTAERHDRMFRPVKVAALLVSGLSLLACGEQHSPTEARPVIAIAVAPRTAVVQAGATLQVTGTVSKDTSNRGVLWMVACAVASCGTISPASTASGAPATYTAPATLPSNGATITITATAIADASASASATLIPVGQIPGYDVGVAYHAYGTDNLHTSFVTTYNQAAVRQSVQAQLQGMADRGATFINTIIWFVTSPGADDFGETYRAHFPMSDQEASNLRAYAQDVAAIRGAGGSRLRLDITFAWLGEADYTIGSPTTGLGYNKDISASAFMSRVATTTDKVVAAVSDVTRPDSVRVVGTIFFKGEVLVPAPGEPNGNPNEGWFLTNNYPRFVSVVSAAGLQPSVYFAIDGHQYAVFDNSFVDSYYQIVNGHRSMFWVYRALRFMVDHGLPVPSRIELSCYLEQGSTPYDQVLQRILDDADATLPTLGAPRIYGVAETYYLADSIVRLRYGRAFATQAAQNSRLQRVAFWTTPGLASAGEQDTAYPFTIEAFLPPPP